MKPAWMHPEFSALYKFERKCSATGRSHCHLMHRYRNKKKIVPKNFSPNPFFLSFGIFFMRGLRYTCLWYVFAGNSISTEEQTQTHHTHESKIWINNYKSKQFHGNKLHCLLPHTIVSSIVFIVNNIVFNIWIRLSPLAAHTQFVLEYEIWNDLELFRFKIQNDDRCNCLDVFTFLLFDWNMHCAVTF